MNAPRIQPTLRGALLCSIVAFLVAPHGAVAQDRLVDRSEFYLGVNVLLGGGVALAQALLSSGDVSPGEAFVKGAFGGALMHGGQRMVGSDRRGLRLLGAQTVAVGASMSRNAGAGAPLASELTLPFYPFYLHLRPGSESPVSVRLSAAATASLAWALVVEREEYARSYNRGHRYRVSFDWKETLLTGAPVFRTDHSVIHTDRGDRAGMHRLGTTWYTTGGRRPSQVRAVLAHEGIHLTQFSRDAILFGVPAGDAVLEALGGPFARLRRVLALDLLLPMTVLNEGLSMALPEVPEAGRWRPYEWEARALSGTR